MRRSLICLTLMIPAAWIAFRATSDIASSRYVAAQDRDAGESHIESRNPFAVPDAAEAGVLVDFVKVLKKLRPGAGIDQEEYDVKAPGAIRQACERILELDRDADSSLRNFARRELLLFRMKDLSTASNVSAADRKNIADDTLQILRATDRTPDDAELATALATTFEDFAPVSEARALYRELGELFIKQSNDQASQRGKFLLGAAYRLGIEGEPFSLKGKSVNERPFDVADWNGKVVLVNFWAAWSDHCLAELPSLKRDYYAFHDRGFEIVTVSLDDDREELLTCLKKHRLPWTTLHDEDGGSEHPAAVAYGIAAYPTSFLLDREGRVLATDLRGRKLTRKLNELLGPATPNRTAYPVFHVRDIVEELTSAGTKLHRDGKTKTDLELRKGLTRTAAEIKLAEPSDEEIKDRDLYRRACESVFIVCSLYHIEGGDEWETSLATAFAVTADGVLSTSCHVFDNEDEADAVVVMDSQKRVFAVRELLAANQHADTCLFRIDCRDTKPLPLADDALPGTRIRILGHPGDSFYFFSTGTLANYERDGEGTTWLNVTADFGQGSSGGPVMDEYGNVVGQVSRTFTLYAGGSATRGLPRRVQAEKAAGDVREPQGKVKGTDDVADPQMVFKACVPVDTLRSLVKRVKAPTAP